MLHASTRAAGANPRSAPSRIPDRRDREPLGAAAAVPLAPVPLRRSRRDPALYPAAGSPHHLLPPPHQLDLGWPRPDPPVEEELEPPPTATAPSNLLSLLALARNPSHGESRSTGGGASAAAPTSSSTTPRCSSHPRGWQGRRGVRQVRQGPLTQSPPRTPTSRSCSPSSATASRPTPTSTGRSRRGSTRRCSSLLFPTINVTKPEQGRRGVLLLDSPHADGTACLLLRVAA